MPFYVEAFSIIRRRRSALKYPSWDTREQLRRWKGCERCFAPCPHYWEG